MRYVIRWLTLFVALVPLMRPLAAQRVTGTVVHPDSVTPLARAIVVANDAHGMAAGRALTNTRGEFVLQLPQSGRYALSVLRIGYRPTSVPAVNVADGETVRVRIVASDAVVTLAALKVKERETCRVNADTGLMVTRVWDEARKAMLSTQLSSDSAPLHADWIEYDRTLDSAGRAVRLQRIRSASHPTTHAFRSVSAEILDRDGYVVADSVGMNYYAPDAAVLLSDAFTAEHCFHLAESPDQPARLIGVAFVPNRSRRDMREIEGTLWVDRASSELRLLEFRYLNLPDPANDANPGGRVEFLRLDDGNWLVNRWAVRMPQIGTRPRISADGMRKTVMSSAPTYLRAVQVTGGEVTSASRADTVVYRATGPSIVVQLTSTSLEMSGAGAVLTLEGTDYRATADSLGRIRLSPVLAGQYRARIQTTLMGRVGMPAIERDVTTRADARVDSIALPLAREVVAKVCPRDSIADGQGMLHGQVRDERAHPVAGVTVTASWKDNFSVVEMGSNVSASYGAKKLLARSNPSGFWRVCGVPMDTPLTVIAASDSTFDMQKGRLENQSFAAIDLVLHRREIVGGVIDSTTRRATRASVEIVVTDEHGAALPDVTLDVSAGGAHTMVTGSTGRATVGDIRPGLVTVFARRIGFKPGQVSALVETGRVELAVRLSATGIPMLDTQRVIGARVASPRFTEFEARRQLGQATAAFTRDDIIKRNPVDAWQMLNNVPSLKVIQTGPKVTVESARGFILKDQKLVPCYLMIIVDGIVLNPREDSDVNLSDLPRPDEIYGIEVFAGPASIPPQYAALHARCGIVSILRR